MKSNKEALKITGLISIYLEDWAPKKISENQGTLDNHRYALGLYFEFLETEKGVSTHNLSHKHFESPIIEEWKIWLQQGKHKCGPATVNNRISSLRAFVSYLEGEHPYIWVNGKGNKNRPCHLNRRSADHLSRYIAEFHGPHPGSKDLVFFSPFAEKGTRRLTTDAVDKRLTGYALKANQSCSEVPADLTSHQLRHARATHLVVNHQINILAISKMLGHEQIETTMRYLDFTAEDKARAFAALDAKQVDNKEKIEKRWLNNDGSLKELCRPRARKN